MDKLKPFSHYQVTYRMGTGEEGKARADLLQAQAERFGLPITKLLTLAVEVLAKTPDAEVR